MWGVSAEAGHQRCCGGNLRAIPVRRYRTGGTPPIVATHLLQPGGTTAPPPPPPARRLPYAQYLTNSASLTGTRDDAKQPQLALPNNACHATRLIPVRDGNERTGARQRIAPISIPMIVNPYGTIMTCIHVMNNMCSMCHHDAYTRHYID